MDQSNDTNHLLAMMVEEQRNTNRLLAALVEALADEGEDGETAPATYMDGAPVRADA